MKLKKYIVIIIIGIVIMGIGLVVYKFKEKQNQYSNRENKYEEQKYQDDNEDIEYEEKKQIIDDLNEKFYSINNLENFYILRDSGGFVHETFVLNNKIKTIATIYQTEEDGNVNKDKFFSKVEETIINNKVYYKTIRNNNVSREINEDTSEYNPKIAWVNYIYPTISEQEYYTREKLERLIKRFIENVKIINNNEEVLLNIENNNVDFFSQTTNAEKKILKINSKTGIPISMTLYRGDGEITTEKFEYKTDYCTDSMFDISDFQD